MPKKISLLVSTVKLPIIIYSGDPTHGILHVTYLYRLLDGILILNRIIQRWDKFHSGFGRNPIITDEVEEDIRLETIEIFYSFIIFLMLVLGFYRGIFKKIRDVIVDLNIDRTPLSEYPHEPKLIKTLRTIRNKMVAHTADIEPRKDDSIPNRLAYLSWYVGCWGSQYETRNRRLNTFGLGVGKESSTHVIPPILDDIVDDVQAFIRLCDEHIHKNCNYLIEQIKAHKSDRYFFIGYYK